MQLDDAISPEIFVSCINLYIFFFETSELWTLNWSDDRQALLVPPQAEIINPDSLLYCTLQLYLFFFFFLSVFLAKWNVERMTRKENMKGDASSNRSWHSSLTSRRRSVEPALDWLCIHTSQFNFLLWGTVSRAAPKRPKMQEHGSGLLTGQSRVAFQSNVSGLVMFLMNVWNIGGGRTRAHLGLFISGFIRSL